MCLSSTTTDRTENTYGQIAQTPTHPSRRNPAPRLSRTNECQRLSTGEGHGHFSSTAWQNSQWHTWDQRRCGTPIGSRTWNIGAGLDGASVAVRPRHCAEVVWASDREACAGNQGCLTNDCALAMRLITDSPVSGQMSTARRRVLPATRGFGDGRVLRDPRGHSHAERKRDLHNCIEARAAAWHQRLVETLASKP